MLKRRSNRLYKIRARRRSLRPGNEDQKGERFRAVLSIIGQLGPTVALVGVALAGLRFVADQQALREQQKSSEISAAYDTLVRFPIDEELGFGKLTLAIASLNELTADESQPFVIAIVRTFLHDLDLVRNERHLLYAKYIAHDLKAYLPFVSADASLKDQVLWRLIVMATYVTGEYTNVHTEWAALLALHFSICNPEEPGESGNMRTLLERADYYLAVQVEPYLSKIVSKEQWKMKGWDLFFNDARETLESRRPRDR